MHFKDLTPYCYGPSDWQGDNILNVGWLGNKIDFERNPPSSDYLEKLGRLCAHGINKMRGFHTCEICGFNPAKSTEFEEIYGGFIGNGEIRVELNGIVFAAPTLIYHYVKDHNYAAPKDFEQAVLSSAQA